MEESAVVGSDVEVVVEVVETDRMEEVVIGEAAELEEHLASALRAPPALL